MLGHLLSTTEENRGTVDWMLAACSILMAALKICDSRLYHAIKCGGIEPDKGYDFLRKLFGDDDVHAPTWWFMVLLESGGIKVMQGETHHQVLQRAGVSNPDETFAYDRDLEIFSNASVGARHPTHVSRTCENIEQIAQWD